MGGVLVDIVHPAHVHFYRQLHRQLVEDGVDVTVIARQKDVTHALLDGFGIPYTSYGTSGQKGLAGQLAELVGRDVAIARLLRRTGASVVVTRNPAGVQAARALRRFGIFDTDDGRAAGIHFRAAAPFAHIITTPTSITEDYGAKHRRYNGYKALAYLHPSAFRPDPSVRDALGVGPDEPYSIVRFVDMVASHDRNEAGLAEAGKRHLVDDLAARMRVFVSSEAPLPAELEPLRLRIPPHQMHDALALATCYVGDSQTMAAEAALVGTPSFQISTWSRRLAYLVELEDAYGLVRSFTPAQVEEARAAIRETLDDDGAEARRRAGWERMLAEKEDVATWYLDLVREALARRARR